MSNFDEFVQRAHDVTVALQARGAKFYGPRIAVLREPEKEMTEGGLYIPEEGKRKEPRGIVVGIGLGVETDDVVYGFSLGDLIMFTKYNPIAFRIKLKMPNGEYEWVALELMHVHDVYIGFGEDE